MMVLSRLLFSDKTTSYHLSSPNRLSRSFFSFLELKTGVISLIPPLTSDFNSSSVGTELNFTRKEELSYLSEGKITFVSGFVSGTINRSSLFSCIFEQEKSAREHNRITVPLFFIIIFREEKVRWMEFHRAFSY